MQPLPPATPEPQKQVPNYKERSAKSRNLFTENILFKIRPSAIEKYAVDAETL